MYRGDFKVSRHYKERFLQRGKLFLYKHEIDFPYDAIKRMIVAGVPNIRLNQVPFYKNKVGCDIVINGRFKFYIRDNTVLTCVVTQYGKQMEWRR